jgi:predicted metal-dependent peptidase
MTKQKIANEGSKNDYTRFKTRPMAAGLLVPRRKSYTCNFACLLDTSGSMDRDNIALGLSQLQSLDDQGIGVITCCDAEVRWQESTKLRTCKPDELARTRCVGGGGTALAGYFAGYEAKLGKKDFLVVITDGLIREEDVKAMKCPTCPVFWLITQSAAFTPPFGKVFQLVDG